MGNHLTFDKSSSPTIVFLYKPLVSLQQDFILQSKATLFLPNRKFLEGRKLALLNQLPSPLSAQTWKQWALNK